MSNIITLEDYSELKKNELKNLEFAPQTTPKDSEDNGVRVNLGLTKDEKGNYKARGYCGCCFLKDESGNTVIDKDSGEKYVLKVNSRFTALSPITMLDLIADDEEFEQYLSMDLPEGERLITYFFNEGLIFAEESEMDNRLLTYISFVQLMLNSTGRTLMSKMKKRSENYVGKVRGKIDFKRQFSKNIARGRNERIFCTFSEKTVDIIENQILKYTLKIVEKNIKGKNYEGALSEKISILKRRFSAVSDVAVNVTDINKVILPGMYSSYRPMYELAKVILSENLSLITTDNGRKIGIIPYAINMPLLFECYARSRIKEAIKELNETLKNKKAEETSKTKDVDEISEKEYYIEMKKFVPEKKTDILSSYDNSYGCKRVTKRKCYIDGYVVPDIVLAYYEKDKWEREEHKKPDFYRVYDAKYKKADNPDRDDRLQFFAYCFAYGIRNEDNLFATDNQDHWYSGLLFPGEQGAKNNYAKINRNHDEDVYYHEVYLDDKKLEDYAWLKW